MTAGVTPYRLSAVETAATLQTDAAGGLTAEEARARLARDGPNELTAQPPIPAWRRFLAQFQAPDIRACRSRADGRTPVAR